GKAKPKKTMAAAKTNMPGTTNAPGTSKQPGTTNAPGVSSQPETTVTPGTSELPGQNPGSGIALKASQGSGTYDSAFQLSLNSDPGTTIYYTLDGSNPVTSATRQTYSGGISITDRKNDPNVLSAVPAKKIQTMHSNHDLITPSASAVDKCTVLRAVAVGEDGSRSDIMTNTYFVGNMSQHISGIPESVQAAGENLAVISITMDQDDLFNETNGIYMIGNDQDAPNFKKKGKEWERSCHIDYFESNGTETSLELAQDCGIRIQGNYSRENVQKSFRLFAREEYGIKNFKYPFFSGLTNAEGEIMEKFKTLVLRNGGNDSFNYKYKDNIMQSFLHEQDCETLHGRPCVVYLDGEYWGHYVLQDDISDNFLQEKHGVDKENVVVYKGSDDPQYISYGYKLDEGELPAGETDESYYLQETLQFLNSHDLSEDTAYQEFMEKYMSEESAVDYFAIMLYLNNRYDWPGKNWSIWRTLDDDRNKCVYEDGRWRFCIYDMDLTTNTPWNGWGNLEGVSADQVFNLAKDVGGNIPKKLYANMMRNASFREKLADKVKKLSTEIFTETEVDARGKKYLDTYRPLHEQFRKRFLASDSDSLAFSNQNDNIAWLKQRVSYVNTLVENIKNFSDDGSYNSPSFGDTDTILPSQDNTLIWQGKWSRTDSSSNETTAKTDGFSLISSDGNFMQWSIDQSIWEAYQKPMLQLIVADGASENARCHVWGETKRDMNQYFYLKEGDQVYPWTTQAIDISGISSNVFCVNANDAQLIEIRVFEGNITEK
ncbi:MAG: CotH kinase family protein, partial [Lachnospiraceae bacterium]|nr:CotH kinase family protein [Lachnospiraceae bacterium]